MTDGFILIFCPLFIIIFFFILIFCPLVHLWESARVWLGVGAQKMCQVKEGMEELSPGPSPPPPPSPHCLVTPSFSTILTSPSSPGSWRDSSWSSWISSSPTWLVLLPCFWELNMAHSPNGDSSDSARVGGRLGSQLGPTPASIPAW